MDKKKDFFVPVKIKLKNLVKDFESINLEYQRILLKIYIDVTNTVDIKAKKSALMRFYYYFFPHSFWNTEMNRIFINKSKMIINVKDIFFQELFLEDIFIKLIYSINNISLKK